jgi:Uma2 family endonuclease
MSSRARRLNYTYREYLALEDESAVRHEYLDGEIYAMAGGTPDHAALAASVSGVLRPVLPPGCRTFSADLRIRIATTGLSTYPDVSVVCGKTQRADDDPMAVTNPVLLVEVTSPSTEDYDRGEKLRHYKSIPSVREIMLVSHRGPRITLHRRLDHDEWSLHEIVRGGIVELASVAGQIRVDDVYRDALEDSAPD